MKVRLLLVLLFCASFVSSSPVWSETQAEKDEKSRINPENNFLGKILGIGAAAGAVKVAADKGGEKDQWIALDDPSIERYKENLSRYLDLARTVEWQYGLSSNFNSGANHITDNYLNFRWRMAIGMALRYENRRELFNDGSAKHINELAFEYYLRPYLNENGSVNQIGAFIGGKTTKVSQTDTNLTFGLLANLYNIKSDLSLHAAYRASLVGGTNFTVDGLAETFVRWHVGPVLADLGGNLDVTDLSNLKYQLFAKCGIGLF